MAAAGVDEDIMAAAIEVTDIVVAIMAAAGVQHLG